MSLIVPVGFSAVSIRFKHTLVARPAFITFGVDNDAAGGAFVQMCNDIMGHWNNNMGPSMDSDVLQGPVTARVGQDGGDPLTVAGSVTYQGGGASSSLPSNCALLTRKLTNLGGRKGRGRFFTPWTVPEASTDEAGTITSGQVASYQAAMDAFLEDLAVGNSPLLAYPMVILHDSLGAGVEPPPTPVTDLVVEPVIATQRRRMRS